MVILLATFGVAFVSALIPLVNVEAYLGAVVATVGDANIWALCVVAGVGQMIGKVLWYGAGRRSMELAWVRKKMSAPKRQAQLRLWRARVQGRPLFSGAVLLASAFVGLPPYAVISVLAGQLRMSFTLFCVTGLVGRIARFAVVAFGVAVVPFG
ncbi:MAG TPA: VTT domain-containing protein [Nocardioidaceae bacterium]|nr:VTT domain-containing protein [Nocardioidaceae bacterium]